jgi:hypothetical protein
MSCPEMLPTWRSVVPSHSYRYPLDAVLAATNTVREAAE